MATVITYCREYEIDFLRKSLISLNQQTRVPNRVIILYNSLTDDQTSAIKAYTELALEFIQNHRNSLVVPETQEDEIISFISPGDAFHPEKLQIVSDALRATDQLSHNFVDKPSDKVFIHLYQRTYGPFDATETCKRLSPNDLSSLEKNYLSNLIPGCVSFTQNMLSRMLPVLVGGHLNVLQSDLEFIYTRSHLVQTLNPIGIPLDFTHSQTKNVRIMPHKKPNGGLYLHGHSLGPVLVSLIDPQNLGQITKTIPLEQNTNYHVKISLRAKEPTDVLQIVFNVDEKEICKKIVTTALVTHDIHNVNGKALSIQILGNTELLLESIVIIKTPFDTQPILPKPTAMSNKSHTQPVQPPIQSVPFPSVQTVEPPIQPVPSVQTVHPPTQPVQPPIQTVQFPSVQTVEPPIQPVPSVQTVQPPIQIVQEVRSTPKQPIQVVQAQPTPVSPTVQPAQVQPEQQTDSIMPTVTLQIAQLITQLIPQPIAPPLIKQPRPPKRELNTPIVKENNELKHYDPPISGYARTDAIIDSNLTKVNEIRFPLLEEHPKISIVIPAYNNLRYTVNCLYSIYKYPPNHSYEVVVVNDKSTDRTKDVLTTIPNLRLINNEVNQGFVRTCNVGSKVAKGTYMYLLNNDAELLPNSVDALIQIYEDSLWSDNQTPDDDTIKKSRHRPIGGVGSKLIFGDGQLQEAGSFLYNDGGAYNFGHKHNLNDCRFNFAQEVSYCSAAALMIKTDLFRQFNGFDEIFSPGYYDETDLCTRLRAAGYQILYQPLSEVIHFHSVTLGPAKLEVLKRNRQTFVNRNKEYLEKTYYNADTDNKGLIHLPNGDLIFPNESATMFKDVAVLARKRVLFIDTVTPTPDMDSGSNGVFYFLKALSDLNHRTTFIPSNLARFKRYTGDLQAMGIEAIYAPFYRSIHKYVKEYGRTFDVVILTRYQMAMRHYAYVRKWAPKATIIFNTLDLNCVRNKREAEITANRRLQRKAINLEQSELQLITKADRTIVINNVERDVLIGKLPNSNIARRLTVLPLVIPIPVLTSDSHDPSLRSGLIFIGGFRHPPNVDAIEHFVNNIWLLITKEIPDITLTVVGSALPDETQDLIGKYPNIKYIGYIKEIGPVFEGARISIVPLRYGAGSKGKIATSLSYGVPVVSSPIGGEGMGLTHNENYVSASVDNYQVFANEIVRLYRDAKLWEKISRNGYEFCKANFSYENNYNIIKNII